MAHSQVHVDLMVEVKEQEPDIINVLLPSSQKQEKETYVLMANNQNWTSKEKERKRSNEATKESLLKMSTGFYLLKKHVPGAS
jgi:hypothetical protein